MIINTKHFGGGSPEPSTGDYFVRVIDYDGTVISETWHDTGDVVTLPTAPTHNGLTFQTWSASAQVVSNTVTVADNDIMVGAVYKTTSGKSEFDITLTAVTGLTVTMQNLTGMTSVDWGDGTTDALLTHTYAAAGDYTISVAGLTAPGSYIFSKTSTAVNYYVTEVRLADTVTGTGLGAFRYCYSLRAVSLSASFATLGNNIFDNCRSLRAVVLPPDISIVTQNAFYFTYNLKELVIPYGITLINQYSFYQSTSIADIVIPSTVTTLGNTAIASCYGLRKLKVPYGVTGIGTSTLSTDYSLTSLKLPSTLNSIGTTAFNNCYAITEYDFSDSTVVPTLAGTNAFTGINAVCKIKVPSALYSAWIAATNWSTYADYIVSV